MNLAVLTTTYDDNNDSYDKLESIECEIKQLEEIRKIQKKNIKIAPYFYGYLTKQEGPLKTWYIVEEALDGTLEELLKTINKTKIICNDILSQVKFLYDKLNEIGKCHGDPKLDNIMYKIDPTNYKSGVKLYLIDFGQGCVDLCPDNYSIDSLLDWIKTDLGNNC
jgi:serine/threonine protein kinase